MLTKLQEEKDCPLSPEALALCLPPEGTERLFAESKWVHEDDQQDKKSRLTNYKANPSMRYKSREAKCGQEVGSSCTYYSGQCWGWEGYRAHYSVQ